MEDFVPFQIAKKIKEKGFSCEYPFAMYNEDGLFFPLYSSDKYYYGIEDFDKHDYIAPTISQVLKWFRKEKDMHIEIFLYNGTYSYHVKSITKIYEDLYFHVHKYLNEDTTGIEYETYELAALSGIEYVLDNLL